MADPITAKSPPQKERVLPPPGMYQAVCVDVVDLGYHPNPRFGGKLEHKCAIVFQIDETHPETGQWFELSQRFTVSMAPQSFLRPFLGSWRGKPYTDAEAEIGAPLERLEGVNATVQVVHSTVGDRTYANIDPIAAAMKGAPKMKPENYTRAPFWAEVKAKSIEPPAHENPDAFPSAIADADDDLPF